MTTIAPISLSMRGSDSWIALRDEVPVGQIELRGDRFVVEAADHYRVGRYRDFSKALTALDNYHGMRRSWIVLLGVGLVVAVVAVGLAVFGADLLF